MFCRRCGSKLQWEDLFCWKCGSKVVLVGQEQNMNSNEFNSNIINTKKAVITSNEFNRNTTNNEEPVISSGEFNGNTTYNEKLVISSNEFNDESVDSSDKFNNYNVENKKTGNNFVQSLLGMSTCIAVFLSMVVAFMIQSYFTRGDITDDLYWEILLSEDMFECFLIVLIGAVIVLCIQEFILFITNKILGKNDYLCKEFVGKNVKALKYPLIIVAIVFVMIINGDVEESFVSMLALGSIVFYIVNLVKSLSRVPGKATAGEIFAGIIIGVINFLMIICSAIYSLESVM